MSPSPTKIRIGVHPVDLDGNLRRPLAELGHGYARVEEERSARAGAGLSELLRRDHAEREARVDESLRKVVCRSDTALEQLREADLADVRHALVDAVERAAVEQVGRVDRVARLPQLVREGREAGVWPCAWWNSNTSAMSSPSGRESFEVLPDRRRAQPSAVSASRRRRRRRAAGRPSASPSADSRGGSSHPSSVSVLARISPADAAAPMRAATCTPWPP